MEKSFPWYAVAEGLIGIFGLCFHSTFTFVTDLAFIDLIPTLESILAINLAKFSLSTLLILPQSILLGMTFPLMSAAIIRAFPIHPGASLSVLYFTNGIGATLGVLISGFVLVGEVGLPGALLTAAIINIILAMIVWLVSARLNHYPLNSNLHVHVASDANINYCWWLLWIAMLTGLASFVYEIAWIRMLSLVLGSSTHSFELMLSAFLAGLAFGGLWIKRRIDHIQNPIRFLGLIQVIMGLCALSTLVLYDHSFELMQAIVLTLQKTELGYVLFNLSSHLIALFIMFPATFCAGMTLPLITYMLLKNGNGEQSIGLVYAANTVGAILGAGTATYVGMPLLGLKGLVIFGAALDMLIGLVLLWSIGQSIKKATPTTATVVCISVILMTLFGIQLDPLKMASGVYRDGTIFSSDANTILFHHDGKTASIDVLKDKTTTRITTNGKPDASINMENKKTPSPDESTMAMLAILPLATHPQCHNSGRHRDGGRPHQPPLTSR